MDTRFKPTHELFDGNGESRGFYLKDSAGYSDADVWASGGRPLQDSELLEWGWTRTVLSTPFRKHYERVHGLSGSPCSDECYASENDCTHAIGYCESCVPHHEL